MDSKTLGDKIANLRSQGVIININDPRELEAYLHDEQGASPQEIMNIDNDAFQGIDFLTRNQIPGFPQRHPITFDEYRQNPSRFKNIQLQYMLWFAKNYLQIPSDRVALVVNEKVIDTIHIVDPPVNIERIRPLREVA